MAGELIPLPPKSIQTGSISKVVREMPEFQISDILHKVMPEQKVQRPHFRTIEKKINGFRIVMDVPVNVPPSMLKYYGYAIFQKPGIIRIRITPRNMYNKQLLSHEELIRRLKVIQKPNLDMGPIIKLAENPLNVLERKGQLVRISEKGLSEGIHFVKTKYENPEECESKDYKLKHLGQKEDDIFEW